MRGHFVISYFGTEPPEKIPISFAHRPHLSYDSKANVWERFENQEQSQISGILMLDKQDFYRGVALVLLVDDPRCNSIRKHGCGYLVNGAKFVFLKYRTNSRAPWAFNFSTENVKELDAAQLSFQAVNVGLICGGDGVCGVSWVEVRELLGGSSGWVSVRRKFRERYSVAGSAGKLKGKVPLQYWNEMVFQETVRDAYVE